MGRLSKHEKLELCGGCDGNFYNGHNDKGVKECWSLKTAKVAMRKKVHVDQVPPWTQKPIRTLSCFHQRRYVMVGPKQTY